MESEQEKYNELLCYTLAYPDLSFIHQYAVDACAAQHADKNTKPIALTFALIGLYLHVEKNYSGKKVQLAHMQLVKRRKTWPVFELPEQRGMVMIEDVLKASPGSSRDKAIKDWCVSVWKAYDKDHKQVIELVQAELRQ